jgi:uncharacterized protein
MHNSAVSDDKRAERERALDETIEESFPASDPPANTPEVGTHVGAVRDEGDVVDNRGVNRFEIVTEGLTSVLTYKRTPQSLELIHTEVPPALRGRHIADALAKAGIESARAEGLRLVATCPFVKAYLQRHPELSK